MTAEEIIKELERISKIPGYENSEVIYDHTEYNFSHPSQRNTESTSVNRVYYNTFIKHKIFLDNYIPSGDKEW